MESGIHGVESRIQECLFPNMGRNQGIYHKAIFCMATQWRENMCLLAPLIIRAVEQNETKQNRETLSSTVRAPDGIWLLNSGRSASNSK